MTVPMRRRRWIRPDEQEMVAAEQGEHVDDMGVGMDHKVRSSHAWWTYGGHLHALQDE